MDETARAQARPYLSIVLPCYNEAANIGPVLGRVCGIVGRLDVLYEIIVVDDGSYDGTSEAAAGAGRGLGLCPHRCRAISFRPGRDSWVPPPSVVGLGVPASPARPALRILRHETNQGYGAAVRTGITAAEGQYIFLTDGDGQFDLGELPEAMRLLGRIDAVLGYRKWRQDPLVRRWMGKCWTLLIDLCLQVCIRDMDCAFKLVDAGLLKRADLISRGALISTEIVASLAGAGARIVQRPVRHLPRRSGRPTGADPRVIGRAFIELAKNMSRLRRIRFRKSAGPNCAPTL